MEYPRRDEFLSILLSLRRSNNTLIKYDKELCSYFKYTSDLTTQSLQKYVCFLSSSNKAASSILGAIGAIKTYCKVLGIEGINFSVINRPRVPIREAQYITDPVFESCTSKISNPNIKSLFTTLYRTGLRVTELLTLTPESVNIKEKTICVIGKGDKERVIPIPDSLEECLTEPFIKWCNSICYRSVVYWTKRYFGDSFSPHSFRHGYTSKLSRNKVNPKIIQRVLGHASYSTTLRYVHFSSEEVFEEINKVM